MPKLNTGTMEEKVIQGSNFGYSAVRLNHLGASEYTLATIVMDVSGSVNDYKDELEKCLQEIIKSLKHSPRANNLLVRLVTFSDDTEEVHGFKLLSECNLDDYKGILNCGGMTALYDASFNAIEASNQYGKTLYNSGYTDINGIVVVVTDGANNASAHNRGDVKDVLKQAVNGEILESMVSILVGVDSDPSPRIKAQLQQYLQDYKNEANFTQYVGIGDANDKNIAKLANFISRSVSSQSSSLGTGGPSQTLIF